MGRVVMSSQSLMQLIMGRAFSEMNLDVQC